eukprot:TRINITY_DN20825_c0_g1_i1.p1 TRINITY_DN20825_c0_g1~~TRINITY_DN20825_c0_g1_i1.p1  ORF type:complete len:730 (-),score=112.16 TRINITY_DN20825_c0_g1_i1:23-2212(-)
MSVTEHIPGQVPISLARTSESNGLSPSCDAGVAQVGLPNTILGASVKTVKRVTYTYPKLPENVSWQWLHRTGFRDYSESAARKIEFAYQQGDSKVRLKSGKSSMTPMEIFFVEMIQHDPITSNTRDVRRLGPDTKLSQVLRIVKGAWRAYAKGLPRRQSFEDYQSLRAAIAAGENISTNDVDDCAESLYYDHGRFSAIARSSVFAFCSMILVLLNAAWLWIGLDIDLNQHRLMFLIGDNIFCALFTLELLIRFIALRVKKSAVFDKWFLFDAVLVLLMIFETWLFPIIQLMLAGNVSQQPFSNFMVLRLARLLRVTRMTRLVRAVPEIMTLLVGIVHAFKSVFVTLVLLMFFVYVCAILFRSVTLNTAIGDAYFPRVTTSMLTLLLHGTFLDAVSDVINEFRACEIWYLAQGFVVFIFLSSFTILNLLIGVLCEIVGEVRRDKEAQAQEDFLENNLLDIFECYDNDEDGRLRKEEFKLLMENPEVVEALDRFGTHVEAIVMLTDVLFDVDTTDSASGKLSFHEIMAVIMRLRAKGAASVTDVVELREFMKHEVIAGVERLRRGQQNLFQCVESMGGEQFPNFFSDTDAFFKAPALARETTSGATISSFGGSTTNTSIAFGNATGDLGVVGSEEIPISASHGVSYVKTVLVDLKFKEMPSARRYRHAVSLTIGEMLAQLAHTHDRLGKLGATDDSGVWLGKELTLGTLASGAAGGEPLLLHVLPANEGKL